jgi:hypothetical protein
MGAPAGQSAQAIAQSVTNSSNAQSIQTTMGTPIVTGQSYLNNADRTVNVNAQNSADQMNALYNMFGFEGEPVQAKTYTAPLYMPGSVVTNNVQSNIDGSAYNPVAAAPSKDTRMGGK